MSKADSLQQALKNNSGKAPLERAEPKPDLPAKPRQSAGREGKEHIGSWLNPDFGLSLRMVQLRQRRDDKGRKVHLADLMAEALNDLFAKYDVPTVHHE